MEPWKQYQDGPWSQYQEKQPEPGLLSKTGTFIKDAVLDVPRAGLGILETGATFLSGVGSEVVGGLAGLAALPFKGSDAGEVTEAVKEWGTYKPKTEAGKGTLQTVGRVLEPAGRELQATERMLGEGAMSLTGSPAIASVATAIPTAAMSVMDLSAGRALVRPRPGAMLEGNFKVVEPSTTQRAISGERSHDLSVGAAQTPKALEREAVSKNLPVPFEGESALTKGQITRNFEQLQFEKEAAKAAETGAPLRARVENQTETLIQNLDAFADLSQPMRYELRDIGQNVDRALIARRDRLQERVNRLYQAARDRGELRQPVQMNTIPEMLNDIQRFEGVAPNAGAIRREAVRLGAAVDEGGQLSPGRMSVDDAELFRQFVNAATDIANPQQSRIRRIAISAIDDATEGAGGDLYATARRARSEMMTEFENVGLTRRLLSTKNGTSERSIAYEDIFKKIMLDSSIEETNKLRSTLLRSGEEGKQAWADLKARGINYIKENALSSSQADSRGNPILSVDKLNRAIKSMDDKGKLESIYGKRNAQAIRDLGDMAKYIYTAPPGAINHSNTASALMVALDSLGTFAVSGVPAPVVSILKQGSKYVKDAKIRKRINESLNYLDSGSSSGTTRGS